MRALCVTTALAALLCAAPALAQPAAHEGHDMSGMPGMDMPGMEPPRPETAQPESRPPQPGPQMAGPRMAGPMDHQMAGHGGAMSGALGGYAFTREASGTAWQPEVSPHDGLHLTQGDWMVMAHATLNGVYDRQAGPRGDEKGFVSGMLMASARRQIGAADTLQFRAMLSPDPVMGRRGYPLLLAAGETADGQAPLVDRQHPHDLFVELSGSLSHRFDSKTSVFVYAGLPGEPAFGPPAFMHRLSIQDSPEAPISHHWLDSTHITFGVVTLGVIHGDWKLDGSVFKGREPDERRYDIEAPKLDSYAARLTWNPSPRWSLQGSWAHLKSPEQLEPDQNQTRWSASAIYTLPLGGDGYWSTTAAWGRRSSGHHDLDAWALESAVKPNAAWTIFARGEQTETNELLPAAGHHGPTYRVAKVSLGAVRDFPVARHVSLGVGGLYALNFVPSGLKPAYGGDRSGAMAFLRIKLH
jgi:hypothetical protein